MEHIHVILADPSQLVRLGLICLLNQMKYPFHIREISAPEKLAVLNSRDLNGLFLVSSSFLRQCPPALLLNLKLRLNDTVSILISDEDDIPENTTTFAEVVEPADHDKTIIRKLEKHLSILSRQKKVNESPEEISDREKDVLRLVAIGLTNKEIADKLFISSHTVITHRKNITKKLGIKTIAGLTMYALINRLIIPEDIN
jgi:DNA-binding CsgD family transcriptional regulator